MINGLLKKPNDKTMIISIMSDGRCVQNSSEVCEIFNQHFAELGHRVQDSITVMDESVDVCKNIRDVNVNLKFRHVSEGEICKLIVNMKPKSSSGVDGLSNLLLRMLGSVLKGPLCILFNKSIEQGIFPEILKNAKVVPLYKGGEPEILDNY